MGTPAIKASANISMVWGTGNAINSPSGLSGLILESLRITPKNGTPTDIEDGAGYTAIQVGLVDGFDASATAVYDSNKALPAEGGDCVLVVPKQDGNNAGTQNVNCTFWSWGWNRQRKKESVIDITITRRPGINS